MADETFLVSGGSGGIGSAVCRRLRSAGHRPLVGFAHSAAAAASVAESSRSSAVPLDLTDAASIESALLYLANQAPQLAGVVLAGSPPPRVSPFRQIVAADMEEQWAVNVVGPQRLLAGLVGQIFRKTRRGIVIGVLSKAMGDAHHPPMAGLGAYVIAKYGMAGLLAILAADYPWLHVATVSPGFTDTKMLKAFDQRFLELAGERTAFRQPDVVASEICAEIERGLSKGAP